MKKINSNELSFRRHRVGLGSIFSTYVFGGGNRRRCSYIEIILQVSKKERNEERGRRFHKTWAKT